jgi:hypothetical protein
MKNVESKRGRDLGHFHERASRNVHLQRKAIAHAHGDACTNACSPGRSHAAFVNSALPAMTFGACWMAQGMLYDGDLSAGTTRIIISDAPSGQCVMLASFTHISCTSPQCNQRRARVKQT